MMPLPETGSYSSNIVANLLGMNKDRRRSYQRRDRLRNDHHPNAAPV